MVVIIFSSYAFVFGNNSNYPFWLEGYWDGRDGSGIKILSAKSGIITYDGVNLNKELVSEMIIGGRVKIITGNQIFYFQRVGNECIKVIIIEKNGDKRSNIFYRF